MQVVEETGSTNAELVAAAVAGARDRSVLVAGHQSAGRGRLDRRWDAPPGANLLVSILFRSVPERPHELTWRVGLAACRAVAEVAGVDATLKWPNDLLVGGAKLAGVLAQAGEGFVVVGIGVNVRWAPPGAADLGEHVDPLDVLAALLRALDEPPDVGLDGPGVDGPGVGGHGVVRPLPNRGEGGDAVLDAYRARLATLGTRVRVELPGGDRIEGRAIDVERDGRLVVLDECAVTHRLDSGDIVHLRPAPGTT